jgi:hypothetical protein
MNDGKHCPVCGKDIGIWPVLTAALPSRVRCPHCKARLAYENSGRLVVTLGLLLLALAIVAFVGVGKVYSAMRWEYHLALAGLVLVVWMPVEWLLTVYLRNRGTLKKAE